MNRPVLFADGGPIVRPDLDESDEQTCRAFGIPRLLMIAIRHPFEAGSSSHYTVVMRDGGGAIEFTRAELSGQDNLWVRLFGPEPRGISFLINQPVSQKDRDGAWEVRIADIVRVGVSRERPD